MAGTVADIWSAHILLWGHILPCGCYWLCTIGRLHDVILQAAAQASPEEFVRHAQSQAHSRPIESERAFQQDCQGVSVFPLKAHCLSDHLIIFQMEKQTKSGLSG